MSRRLRLVLSLGAVFAVGGVALAGPVDLRQRAVRGYRCVVPVAVQRALRAGPSWDKAPAGATRDALALLDRRLTQLGTRSFMVIRDAQTLYESHARCHGPFTQHYTASAAKALVGGLTAAVALDSGWVRLDDHAIDYVSAWQAREDVQDITLRHLSSHSSGMDEAAVDFDYGTHLPGWKGRFWGPPESRWSVALEDVPTVFEPGSAYRYSNPAFAVFAYGLTAAVDQHTDATITSLLDEGVMTPLGIPGDEWTISGGESYAIDGLHLHRMGGGAGFSARALAALGELMLNGGRIGDRRVLSEASIDAVTRYTGTPPLSTLAGNPAPGVGWHTNANGAFGSLPVDAFLAAGAGHQVLLVVPSLNLVVVRSGDPLGGPAWGPEYWARLETEFFAPLMRAIG